MSRTGESFKTHVNPLTCQNSLDVAKVVFAAFTLPLIVYAGALVATYVANEWLSVKTPEELLEKLVLVLTVWLSIPTVKLIFASYVMKVGTLCSEEAKRIAPWLLAAGFAASLYAYTLYSPFFATFKEGWRELTEYVYFVPIPMTYLIASQRLLLDD